MLSINIHNTLSFCPRSLLICEASWHIKYSSNVNALNISRCAMVKMLIILIHTEKRNTAVSTLIYIDFQMKLAAIVIKACMKLLWNLAGTGENSMSECLSTGIGKVEMCKFTYIGSPST